MPETPPPVIINLFVE